MREQIKDSPANGKVFINKAEDKCKVVYSDHTYIFSERDAYYMHRMGECLPYVYSKKEVIYHE